MSNIVSRLLKSNKHSSDQKRTSDKLAELKSKLANLKEGEKAIKLRIKNLEGLSTKISQQISEKLGHPGIDESLSQSLRQIEEKADRALSTASSIETNASRAIASVDSLKVLCGRVATNALATLPVGTPFSKVEFQVYSQWGEDGIIQHLLHHLPQIKREFVEFGVETYAESNTRFLLIKDNWRGLVLDGSDDYMSELRASDIYWRHDLTAKGAFVTPDNINALLSDNGFKGSIGILSVDVDGIDYWIWKAIEVVDPAIVIAEYNSVFGPNAVVTVPRDDSFQRSVAHHSNIFYGASLSALEHLADEKGFDLVGVNSAGNNAFFVKRGIDSPFAARRACDVFVEANFREAREKDGSLNFASAVDRRKIIQDCEVFDITSNKLRKLGEVLGLLS